MALACLPAGQGIKLKFQRIRNIKANAVNFIAQL